MRGYKTPHLFYEVTKMNKIAIRQMLIKEVKSSNISQLAQSMLVEILEEESAFNRNPEKDLTGARTHRVYPQEELATQKVYKVYIPGKNIRYAEERAKIFPKIYAETMELLKGKKQGYKIKISKLVKKYKLTDRARYHLRMYFIDAAENKKEMVVTRESDSEGWFVALPNYSRFFERHPISGIDVSSTEEHIDYPFNKKKATPKKLDRKEFRRKFMTETTRKYMNQGMPYLKAAQMASMDYSAYCKKRDAKTADGEDSSNNHYEHVAAVDFPNIKGVTDAAIPYLQDLLRKLDKGMIPSITEPMDAYILDLKSENWSEFISDILLKSEQIKISLGLTQSKNFVVRWNKIFFE